MAFEVFEFRGRISGGNPMLTIMRTGMFSLNGAARSGMFQGVERVVLMYDADTRRIAIKPEKKATQNSHKLSKTSNMMFAARTFLKYYQIDYSETKKYELTWDSSLKAAVCDLKKPSAAGKRQAKGRKSAKN